MEMFNIFKTEKNDFNHMLHMAGQEIFVNGKKANALISNTKYLKEYDDKYISTDFNMQRGDYIFYDNKYWMLTSQVGTPRYESFKALMRQVEHDVVFNFYYLGETTDYLLKCPAIVSRTSDFTQEYSRSTGSISVVSEIHLFVRDTEKTRKIINMANKSNGQIIIGQRNYDITGVSVENKGVLDITCKMGIRNSFSDYVNNIYWSSTPLRPSDWQTKYDLSFYEREGVTPTLPSAPNGLQTNVGEIKGCDIKNQTSTSLGEISFFWTHDDSKTKYREWNGYRVALLKNDKEVFTNSTTDNFIKYNNLQAGEYSIKVSILFTTYAEGEGSLPQTSSRFQIIDEIVKPLPPSNYETVVTPMDIQAFGETTKDSDGVVTYTWGKDINAENYSGFVGYTLYLYQNGTYSHSINFDKDTTSYKWINRSEGNYSGQIVVRFVNGETTILGSIKYFENAIVQDNFEENPW